MRLGLTIRFNDASQEARGYFDERFSLSSKMLANATATESHYTRQTFQFSRAKLQSSLDRAAAANRLCCD